MELKQVEYIINQGEGLRVEFKKTTNSVPNDFLDHLVVGFANVALPAALFNASWEELLLYLVPSWSRNGTQLDPLDWPKNQVLEVGKIKEVPSWHKKGTELLKRKTWYLIGILSLCTEPIKLKDLLHAFDYKNKKSFRDLYIKPLREVDFIRLTNPETPTDPDNKYIISEQGKAFLFGQNLLI